MYTYAFYAYVAYKSYEYYSIIDNIIYVAKCTKGVYNAIAGTIRTIKEPISLTSIDLKTNYVLL